MSQLNSLSNFSPSKPFMYITFCLTDLLLAVSLLCKYHVHRPLQLLLCLQFHLDILCCRYTCSLYSFLPEDHLGLFSFFLKSHLLSKVKGFCSTSPFCTDLLICFTVPEFLWHIHSLFSHTDLLFAQPGESFSPLCRKSL